jgi:hypothetical protein
LVAVGIAPRRLQKDLHPPVHGSRLEIRSRLTVDEELRVVGHSHLARVLGNELAEGRGRSGRRRDIRLAVDRQEFVTRLLGRLRLGGLSKRDETGALPGCEKDDQDAEFHGIARLLKRTAYWHAHPSTPPPALSELEADDAPERP